MAIKKAVREEVHLKYSGHCGYCGNDLPYNKMQVDHVKPQYLAEFDKSTDYDAIENLMPSCRRCNHYKRADDLEMFRRKMITLHERLAKPYINKVGIDFGIIEIHPFDGVFYFEKQ